MGYMYAIGFGFPGPEKDKDRDDYLMGLSEQPVVSSSLSTILTRVVLIAGQSNAVGVKTTSGLYVNTPTLDPTNDRVYQWAIDGAGSASIANTPILAADPLRHPSSTSAGSTWAVGPGMPFARTYIPSIPSSDVILLVPTGVGGTGLIGDTWASPSGREYLRANSALTSAINSGGPNSPYCDTIIWWQAENDMFYSRDAGSYTAAVSSVFAGFRAVTRCSSAVIMVMGVVPEYWWTSSNNTNINYALAKTALQHDNVYFVPPPNQAYTPSDTWHATVEAQRSLGVNVASARTLATYYKSNVPATPSSVGMEGETFRFTENMAPAYAVQWRPTSSSASWTQSEYLMYPMVFNTINGGNVRRLVIPGSGDREARVVARSRAGDSSPSSIYYTTTTASAAYPQPIWDHDYDASSYDATSNYLLSIKSVGADTTEWTVINSAVRGTLNGVGVAVMSATTAAFKRSTSVPSGSYSMMFALYEPTPSGGPTLFGPGELTAQVGIQVIRGIGAQNILGGYRFYHDNVSSKGAVSSFGLVQQGYVCVGVTWDARSVWGKLYVNGSLISEINSMTRTQNAPSVKVWNALADNRSDNTGAGARLAYKCWSGTVLTQEQIIQVGEEIRLRYGINWSFTF